MLRVHKTKEGRNGLIGKIHVAKKQLAVTDDSYRAILVRVTGKDTCSQMGLSELENVLNEFKRLGFKPAGGKRAGERKKADTAQATMIRALWLDLYHLGAISEPSEDALAAFAKRTCGIPALQWCSPSKADAIIRALRGWLKRIGFAAPLSYQVDAISTQRYYAKADAGEYSAQAIAWKVLMIMHQMDVLAIERTDDNSPISIDADNLDATIEAYGAQIRAKGIKAK